MPPFRVVLSDHQKLFLQAISKNIEEIPGLEVIGEVCGGPELLEFLKKSTTDMIIMDVANLQDLETAKKIKLIYPEVKILIITMEKSKEFLFQAISARADGYMLKENSDSDLITAIEEIRLGGSYVCNIILGKIADIMRERRSMKLLSAKEIKVLTLRCESKTCREIAELLSLKTSTVTNHLAHIKKKLNIKTQSDLIKYSIKQGYIKYNPLN